MENFDDIKAAIEDTDTNDETSNTPERLTIAGADPIEILSTRVSALTSENAKMKETLKRLEDIVMGLVATRNETDNKTRISIPVKEYFGSKPPASVVSSYVEPSNIPTAPPSTTGSVSDYDVVKPHTPINPFASSYPVASGPAPPRLVVSKSNTATAPMGYTNKASVWGTALASLLISSMRFYLTKTQKQGFTIDETQVMTNCITLAPVLYTSIMHRELPGVKSEVTKYLSQSISRTQNNEVPLSYAEDWYNMEGNELGKEVMTTLNNLILIAQLVPEAVTHPLSQIIMLLVPPVVRNMSNEIKFAMMGAKDATPIPNQWERWCMALKKQALIKYVKYRLSGMPETQVTAKMSSEMRREDLVDKKHAERFSELRVVAPDMPDD